MMEASRVFDPLSSYAGKTLSTYFKFPENEPFTAMDWNAGEGGFLKRITNNKENAYLYGVSPHYLECNQMNQTGFHRVSQADYRSESKITNEAFSLMVVNPNLDSRLVEEVLFSVDPFTMPNFEEEIRASVMRQEEERERLLKESGSQIDFGALDENNQEQIKPETPEERTERLQLKMKKELDQRIKAWRKAMKEQQKKLSSMRYDAFLLNRATHLIRPGGILVMVTLKELIDDTIAFKLVNSYEDIRILRLDDEEYPEYRKCVIIGKKRHKNTREDFELGKALSRTKEKKYKTFGKIRDITVSEDDERYERQVFRQKVDAVYGVIEHQTEPLYTIIPSDPEDIVTFRVGPVTASEAAAALRKTNLFNTYKEKHSQIYSNKNPVTPTPLHKGHIMLLLTSGFLNGYIGKGPDQHLVKGSAIKDVREFMETEDDGTTRVVEREFYNIGVKLLNANGEFKKIM